MFMPARLPGHGRALRTLHNCLLGVSYGPDFYALLAAQQADDGGFATLAAVPAAPAEGGGPAFWAVTEKGPVTGADLAIGTACAVAVGVITVRAVRRAGDGAIAVRPPEPVAAAAAPSDKDHNGAGRGWWGWVASTVAAVAGVISGGGGNGVGDGSGGSGGRANADFLPPGSDAYIMTLAVLPSYRSRGIGRKLLRDAMRTCAARGCRRISLHCLASNTAARGLYTSVGFRVAARLPVHYCIDGVMHDGLLLHCDLVPRDETTPVDATTGAWEKEDAATAAAAVAVSVPDNDGDDDKIVDDDEDDVVVDSASEADTGCPVWLGGWRRRRGDRPVPPAVASDSTDATSTVPSAEV